GTLLTVRAVGTDGSSFTPSPSTVVFCDCSTGIAAASANLTLNQGTTYQLVVTPSAAFTLSRSSNLIASADQREEPSARSFANNANSPHSGVGDESAESRKLSAADRWMNMFGVRPEVSSDLAQLKPAVPEAKQTARQ